MGPGYARGCVKQQNRQVSNNIRKNQRLNVTKLDNSIVENAIFLKLKVQSFA